jgi:hypothetical protein
MFISNTAAAAANGADPMISGQWIIAVIGAAASAVALVIGKMQGRKEAQRTTLESPVPEVPTRKVSTPPSWDAHRALCDRVLRLEDDMKSLHQEVKKGMEAQADQFRQLMVAGADRELRISEKLEGFASAIHRRIDETLHSASQHHPKTRTGR